MADLRELRERRRALDAQYTAQQATAATKQHNATSEVERAMRAAERLQEALTAADPQLVREALSRLCKRIDLWFTHKRTAKLVRSTFSRGIVKFHKPTSLLGHAGRS